MRLGTVDRAIDRPESKCSLELGRSTGRLNGQIFDRWSVDRPVDRKVNFDLAAANGQNLYGGYLYLI